uniref:Uncharacterized protein n=1 Tax=Klebsiella pneumoniae TaxID=573 RepID=A0A2P1BNV5_KLEPN|nr:hypothetical protein [Klebsiella pneumoniae]
MLCARNRHIFYVDADCWHCRSYVFLLQRLFVSRWGKAIILIMCIVVAITEVFVFIEPESTYKQIQTNKQDVIYTLKTAESPHLKHSRQGFWLKQRCPVLPGWRNTVYGCEIQG